MVSAITPTNSPTAYHCTLPVCRYFKALPVRPRVVAGTVHGAVDHGAVEPGDHRGRGPRAASAAPLTTPSSTFWLNQLTPADNRVAHRVHDRPHVEGVDVVPVLEHVPQRPHRSDWSRVSRLAVLVESVAGGQPEQRAHRREQRDPRHEIPPRGSPRRRPTARRPRRAAARRADRRPTVAAASATSGPVIVAGDSCGCAVALVLAEEREQHHAHRVERGDDRGHQEDHEQPR